MILSGTQPFRGPAEDLIKQIKKAEFVFGGCDWNRMPKAKDLVSKMIVKDPNRRLSANEVLAHPWLQDQKIIVKAKSLMGARLLFPPKVMIKLPEKQAVGNSLAKREWESPPNDSEDSNPIADVDYENNEKSRNGQPKPIVASPPRKKTKRVKVENREIQI